jgi:hypothetical protein
VFHLLHELQIGRDPRRGLEVEDESSYFTISIVE